MCQFVFHDTESAMASMVDIVEEKLEQNNSCCKELKEKYLKLKTKGKAFNEAAKLAKFLNEEYDKVKAHNLNLEKALLEERSRADAEKAGKDKELDCKISLENKISVLKFEISQLRQKGGSGAHEGEKGVALLQNQICDGQREIEQLQRLLEKEKINSSAERKKGEEEKKKAAEACKILEEEKSRADEIKRVAEIEHKKAEEYKIQLESAQKNRKLDAQNHKLDRGKRYSDLEKTKAEELRKLTEENKKKIMEEKRYANNLSRQLEESIQKIKELENKVHELVSFKKTEANDVPLPPDKRMIDEIAKLKDKHGAEIIKESLKLKDVSKKYEVEKCNARKEKKRADDLSRLLEEDRRTIEELKRENHELKSSRNLAEASVIPCNKCKNPDLCIREMKLLKKQLKLQKLRVKHANEVTMLEKGRNNVLQQELCYLKQDLFQFSHRLGFMDKYYSCGNEGIDELAKTEGLSKSQKPKYKRNKSVVKPIQMYLRGESGQRPSGRAMDANNHFGKTLELSAAPLVPGSNFSSGIDKRLGSPLGGSDGKLLTSSAISSSIASFSDGQLTSQGKGAFSVTKSAEFAEEILKLQKSNTRLPSKANMINNENLVAVADDRVSSPLRTDIGIVTGQTKKRRIESVVESIGNLFSEGKKLHLQMEEKMSYLQNMLNKQYYNPLDDSKCLVPNPKGDSYAKFGGLCKKKKISHKKKQVANHSIDDDAGKKKIIKMKGGELQKELVGQTTSPASNITGSTKACRDCVINSVTDQETWTSFKKVVDMDYMKLLDLDNPDDENRYNKAREKPLSPTLPLIEFVSGKAIELDDSKLSMEETFYLGLSAENDNMVPSCSFDVIHMEIISNNMENMSSGKANDLLLLKNGKGLLDPSKGIGNKDNACCYGIHEGKSVHDNTPELCIVLSVTKDRESISRIYRATRNCISECDLSSLNSWAVQKILHGIVIEDLVPREKACVFLSLMLYNFSTIAALRDFGNFLTSASNLFLDSFAGHIRSVISDMETRCMILESFCLDELFSLIEDFLMDARILVCNIPSSEASSNSRISISLHGIDIDLSYKKASHDQLVAGSIILGSMCVAVDEIGFICEVSYSIFQTPEIDSSLRLTILHIFAYLCGKKYFTLSSYSLLMVVIKSLVTYLERLDVTVSIAPLQFVNGVRQEVSPCSKWPQFPTCSKCPFSEEAVSLDDLIPMLLEKLQYHALSEENKHLDVKKSVNSLQSIPLSDKVPKQSSGYERASGFLDMNCDESCSLDNGLLATQSDSIINRVLGPSVDVLSLVELVANKMSWAWLCSRVVPQLLKILELCELYNLAAAIVILLGQLGRIGVGANGYEDSGVENMRSRLTAFLHSDNSVKKVCLPFQIATVTALLPLIPENFENIMQNNSIQPTTITSESSSPDVIRKWFSLLSNEQQSLTSCLLQSVDVNTNQDNVDISN